MDVNKVSSLHDSALCEFCWKMKVPIIFGDSYIECLWCGQQTYNTAYTHSKNCIATVPKQLWNNIHNKCTCSEPAFTDYVERLLAKRRPSTFFPNNANCQEEW